MFIKSAALQLLQQEAYALLNRLSKIKPFALQETMVPAAAPSISAQVAVERFLVSGRNELQRMVNGYLSWLQSPDVSHVSIEEAHRQFTLLRLKFNAILSQFDIFADVMTQRSEHETGVWLAGLDVLASDAINLPQPYFHPPPVVCYLDRGPGAAIRRARTRLPGGGENPVAIIRVPRERMVGNGIASSLIHEVGHQGAALLDLIASLQPPLTRFAQTNGGEFDWLFRRWISEILADFWSISRVGITSTRGLMGVVSLPKVFVFRANLDDPHPIPWIRVKISCAIGNALYPHLQWAKMASVWESYYPLNGLNRDKQYMLTSLEASIPAFVALLLSHRPVSLRGHSLEEIFAMPERQPGQLRRLFQRWRAEPNQMRRAAPTLVFAVLGQAQVDGYLAPEIESWVLTELLTRWTLRRTLQLTTQY